MPEEVVAIIFILTAGVLLLPFSIGMTIRALKGPKQPLPPHGEDLAHLQAELQHVRDELAFNREEMKRLGERQEFVEALLDKRVDPTALPPHS